MANRTLEISSIFKAGLRSEDSDNRGLLKAKEYRGLRAEDFGARDIDPINNIVSLDTMYLGDRGSFHEYHRNLGFPYPQAFIGKSKSLLIGDLTMTEFNHVAGTMPGVLSDIRTVAEIESDSSGSSAFPSNAGYWHIADFGDTYYLFTDDLVIIRSPFLKAADDGTAHHFYSSAVTVRTGCAFRGQLITGGFDESDYHSAAWITLWDAWTALAGAQGIASTAAKGPGKNWVRWGTIGGGDFILHWFPTTFARFGGRTAALGWREGTILGQFITNGDISDGMMGYVPGPVDNALPFEDDMPGVGWFFDDQVIQSSRKALFFTQLTGVSPDFPLFLRQHTKKYFLNTAQYNVSIKIWTSHAGPGFPSLKISIGDDIASPFAISSAITPTAQATWETKTFSFVISGGISNVVYIRPEVIVADEKIMFADLSIVQDSGATGNIEGYDQANNPYFWEYLRRGDIGFMPMPSQGAVLNTSPLRNHVIVLSEDAVHAITPATADGIPTYGLTEHLHHAGILSRSALASDGRGTLIFVDETGELQRVGNDLSVERLGFKEYFSGKTDLIGGYDPVKKAFYIGDEDETFRLDRDGRLTQVRENRVTNVFSSAGALSGLADTGHTSLGTVTWDYAGTWTSGTDGTTGENFASTVANDSDALSSVETFTTVIGKKYLVRIAIHSMAAGFIQFTFAGVTSSSYSTPGVKEVIITATTTSSKLVITKITPIVVKVSADLVLIASYDQDNFSIESDYYDLGHAGTKTLQWLELDYKDITSLEITVTYRTEQDGTEIMIGPLVGNNGQFHVGIAFTEFKLLIEGIRGTDPSISRLDAKYSFIDDRTQRHSRAGSPLQMEPRV